jgi:hypothetical protein
MKFIRKITHAIFEAVFILFSGIHVQSYAKIELKQYPRRVCFVHLVMALDNSRLYEYDCSQRSGIHSRQNPFFTHQVA